MKDYEIKQVVGVCAYDGTIFRFDGNPEKAKEECKKYEQSAKMVVLSRLEGVLIKHSLKKVETSILNSKEEKIEAPENYYIDDDLCRYFDYYDYASWLFHPTKQEDIENFLMYINLCGCDGEHIRKQLKVGDYYSVIISTENNCAKVLNREIIMKSIEEAITREETYAKVFFNPDDYIYTWDKENGYRFVKKED